VSSRGTAPPPLPLPRASSIDIAGSRGLLQAGTARRGRSPDAFAPLLFARRANGSDIIAYASGAAGSWTRILAPRYGAPVAYGNVGPHPDEHGVSLDALVTDYGFPALTDVCEVYGIVGTAVSRSLSPRLHNAAHRASGRSALYLCFHAESLERFMTAMDGDGLAELGLRFGGATVSAPHKEAAMAFAHHAAPATRVCRSANNLRHRDDGWHASTTDPEGVLRPRCGVASLGIMPRWLWAAAPARSGRFAGTLAPTSC
jgi:3-dehydroquinate dehydratase/shikimate dehydrogenase